MSFVAGLRYICVPQRARCPCRARPAAGRHRQGPGSGAAVTRRPDRRAIAANPAKAFYTGQAGFHLDVDTTVGTDMRVVQVTPPGSACSVGFGAGITAAPPGSAQGLHLVVSDIVAARDGLVRRGVKVSEVRHLEAGNWVPGPHPERASYESFADFADPDGNVWVLQEVNRAEPAA